MLLNRFAELGKDIEVYSDIDPLLYLRQYFREGAAAGSVLIDLGAWATVLRAFRKQPGLAPPKEECIQFLSEHRRALGLEEGPQLAERLDVLAEKCEADPYLCDQVGRIVAGDPQFKTLSNDQIIEEVRYHARAHYQHLWMTCTDQERVVLHRLSTDGFASPHGRDVVEQLLRRGLW